MDCSSPQPISLRLSRVSLPVLTYPSLGETHRVTHGLVSSVLVLCWNISPCLSPGGPEPTWLGHSRRDLMSWPLEEESCSLLWEFQGRFLENVKAGWGILEQP